MEAKHIVLIISSMGGGGAERVIADLAGYIADRGRRVTLMTLDGDSKDAYELHSQVERVRLNIMWRSTHIWNRFGDVIRRLLLVRNGVRALKPDVVVSFVDMTNVRVLLALLGTGIRVVVSERCNPCRHPIGRLWAAARRIAYPVADVLVVQTENVAKWAKGWLATHRVVVIPNAVRTVTLSEGGPRPHGMPTGPVILAMGRIDPQKGYDLLIEAFAAAAGDCGGWSLVILGDGPGRGPLQELAHSLGLSERVRFVGRQDNPFTWMRHASLFVLSSRYEGFPNAILEAMQCGLPVLSFDCPDGPAEIVRDGIDGMLVPPEDVAALAHGITRLVRDVELRTRLAQRASEVTVRFPPERIYGNWLALCDRVSRRAA